ncbi:MAG: phosphodiester glycosidase family protein [Bacteroidota bacterium]
MKISLLIGIGVLGFVSLWGQTQPLVEVPDSQIVAIDTLIVDSLGMDSVPVSDSLLDTLAIDTLVAMPDSSLKDSVVLSPFDSLQVEIAALQARVDSLVEANARLQLKASRRLSREAFVDSFRQYAFTTCIVDPKKVHIQLFNQIKQRKAHTFETVAELAQAEGKRLIFAMNGGMYERSRLAKGLLVLEGETQQVLDTATAGYGNFYMQPNGVFAIDTAGKAVVWTTQTIAADSNHVWQYATQSGPMMVIDGKINDKFNDGSPNRHIRNAVGVTPSNEVVFAISQRPVTFFELSSFMIQQGCTNALYLDGAISQGYFPDLDIGSLQRGNHLGPIIGIFE